MIELYFTYIYLDTEDIWHLLTYYIVTNYITSIQSVWENIFTWYGDNKIVNSMYF